LSKHIIGFQNEEHRKDMRRPLNDITLVIGGEKLPVINISLRGFLCSGYSGNAAVEDEIIVQEIHDSRGGSAKINAKALVARADQETGEIAAGFIDIKSTTFSVLEKVMMRRPLKPTGGI